MVADKQGSSASADEPTSSVVPSTNWCHTQENIHRFNYEWAIDNFSLRREEMGEALKSSTFYAPGPNANGEEEKLQWCLKIYPKGWTTEHKGYVSVFLSLVQCNKTEVLAKFKFSLLNVEQTKAHTLESEIVSFAQDQWLKTCGFTKFIERDFLLDTSKGLLSDDQLTISCEVFVVADTINITGVRNLAQFRVPPCKLAEDFGSLFEEQQFSDAVLCASEKEFNVHKAILAARSPVFKAMFQSGTGMTEAQTGRVEIKDIDPEVLEEMLRFMYTGLAPNLKHMAAKLLVAADMYQLFRLKAMCEKSLTLSLNNKNAADTLILADLHSAEQLKMHAIDYTKQHANEVMKSKGWQKLAKGYPLLESVFKATQSASSIIRTRQSLSNKSKKWFKLF